PQSAPATPALAPSGNEMVFALTAQTDPKTGFGSDLYEVNLDGSNLHPLLQHEADNVFYSTPRLDPTGNVLYFQRTAGIIEGGQYVRNDYSIERMDLRTGERKKLLVDGGDFGIPPAADRLIYVHLTEGQPDTLWTSNVAAGGLFVVTVADGSTRTVTQGKDFFFGGLVWLK